MRGRRIWWAWSCWSRAMLIRMVHCGGMGGMGWEMFAASSVQSFMFHTTGLPHLRCRPRLDVELKSMPGAELYFGMTSRWPPPDWLRCATPNRPNKDPSPTETTVAYGSFLLLLSFECFAHSDTHKTRVLIFERGPPPHGQQPRLVVPKKKESCAARCLYPLTILAPTNCVLYFIASAAFFVQKSPYEALTGLRPNIAKEHA